MTFTEMLKKTLSETIESSSNNGFSVSGNFIHCGIERNKNNNLMTFEIKGSKTLTKIKSSESLKDEYEEENHEKIEKFWDELSKEKSKELEKLVKEFESGIIKIASELEKETNKF